MTRDRAAADRVRVLRNQGSTTKYEHVDVGYNSRMDELQAAVLRIKLRHLDGWNARRRELAERYDRLLAQSCVQPVKTARGSARHLYVVRTPDRDLLVQALQGRGIGAGIHYPRALPSQPSLQRYAVGSFPVAERAALEVLSLPLYPELTAELQDVVVRELVCFPMNR